MDPEEIEFLAENMLVEVVPNFNKPKIDLVCGTVGPFRAGIPVLVPLWLAVNLKGRQKCKLVAPSWMNLEYLENLKKDEQDSPKFCKVPSEYYIIEAQIFLRIGVEDISQRDALRTVIKDIWDIRLAKLRTSVDTFIKHGGIHAQLDNLTSMEITAVRPLLPHALDFVNRIRAAHPGSSRSQNTLSSASFPSSI